MSWEIRQGDALERLAAMPDESVNCCVTSPPLGAARLWNGWRATYLNFNIPAAAVPGAEA